MDQKSIISEYGFDLVSLPAFPMETTESRSSKQEVYSVGVWEGVQLGTSLLY